MQPLQNVCLIKILCWEIGKLPTKEPLMIKEDVSTDRTLKMLADLSWLSELSFEDF